MIPGYLTKPQRPENYGAFGERGEGGGVEKHVLQHTLPCVCLAYTFKNRLEKVVFWIRSKSNDNKCDILILINTEIGFIVVNQRPLDNLYIVREKPPADKDL